MYGSFLLVYECHPQDGKRRRQPGALLRASGPKLSLTRQSPHGLGNPLPASCACGPSPVGDPGRHVQSSSALMQSPTGPSIRSCGWWAPAAFHARTRSCSPLLSTLPTAGCLVGFVPSGMPMGASNRHFGFLAAPKREGRGWAVRHSTIVSRRRGNHGPWDTVVYLPNARYSGRDIHRPRTRSFLRRKTQVPTEQDLYPRHPRPGLATQCFVPSRMQGWRGGQDRVAVWLIPD